MNTAILVDGGFYRKRAHYLWGKKTGQERARELSEYCKKHLIESHTTHDLYRIFYYDCPPISKQVYHPLLKKPIDFSTTDTYKWTIEFINQLKSERKFALRLGSISENFAHFNLREDMLRKLMNGAIQLSDLKESDFELDMRQKGVDMKIGVDIASLAYKKQVQQIVLISGDSDFVPAAKLARREGIDFVLDPMKAKIKDDLYEHIDGIVSHTSSPREATT